MDYFEINLQLDNTKAYLLKDKPLTFDQLDISPTFRSFHFETPAYLNIEILKFIPEEKRINVQILSYNVGACNLDNYSQEEIEFLESIEYIGFFHIDTSAFYSIAKGIEGNRILASKSNLTYINGYRDFETKTSSGKDESVPIIIQKEFSISFNKVTFHNGYISFPWKYKELKKNLVLEIPNSEIHEEFEAVKEYFKKALKAKKIKVKAEFEINDDHVLIKQINSPEIDSINSNIIESIKYDYLWKQTKIRKQEKSDQVTYSIENYFTENETKSKPDVFFKDEENLLDVVLKITNSKHYKQIRYLSNLHQAGIMKLRFVFKPFSCIFLVHGEQYSYFIWETLDTEEATYIWQSDKSKAELKKAFKKIESIINDIKADGRNHYLYEQHEQFTRIKHDYSDEINGFSKWRGQLESLLA